MKVKVCVVQDSPVFFDKEKTIQKAESLTNQYSNKGCELIIFPESYIPGYPRGFSFGTNIGRRTDEGRILYKEYHNNCVNLQSEDLIRLENIAKQAGVYLVIGITEKSNVHGSLFCSMIYISPEKGLLGVHRKIKATGTERIVWGKAAGDSLVTFQTKVGKVGGLICWENYMPLARMAIYRKGVEIYIAPTADSRDSWTSTLKHIAIEGRCFVVGCNQFFTKSFCPEKYLPLVESEPEMMCRGGSMIVSPSGEIIAGPLFDKAGALSATIDLDEIVRNKLDFDVIGHYSRDDIFDLKIINQPEMLKE